MLELKERDCLARIAKLDTKHGTIETPTLMPVINPNIIVIEPKEMQEKFGVQTVITNSYIIHRNEKLKVQALEKGVHNLINFSGPIMTDSGTFQSYIYGDVEINNKEIVEFQNRIGSDIGTILDVFTEPEFSYEKTKDAVDKTAAVGKEAKEINKDMLLAGTIQGSVFSDLREYSAKKMNELDFDYYPIGGVVPLLENYRYAEVVESIIHSKMFLSPSKPTHLFGAGHPMFFSFAVLLGIDFFDSAAYVKYAKKDRFLFPSGTLALENMKYWPYHSPISDKYEIDEIKEMEKDERIKIIARHNLYISMKEIEHIKQCIFENSLWEYVEMISRTHPCLLTALRILNKHKSFLEKYERLSKKGAFYYTGRETLNRPIVHRFQKWISEKYIPVGKIMVKEEVIKPYHIWIEDVDKDVNEIIINSPLGPVPLELDEVYPIAQSIYPNMNISKSEETLVQLKERNVIKKESFDVKKIKAIADYQFGLSAGESLFSGNLEIIKSKNTGKIRNILNNEKHVASMRANDGFFTLKLNGAKLLHSRFKSPLLRVIVNEDSAEFNRKGSNVFAKFIIEADENIRPYNDVLIVDEKDNLIAVGKALMNREEMLSFKKGVAVKVKEGIEND